MLMAVSLSRGLDCLVLEPMSISLANVCLALGARSRHARLANGSRAISGNVRTKTTLVHRSWTHDLELHMLPPCRRSVLFIHSDCDGFAYVAAVAAVAPVAS